MHGSTIYLVTGNCKELLHSHLVTGMVQLVDSGINIEKLEYFFYGISKEFFIVPLTATK